MTQYGKKILISVLSLVFVFCAASLFAFPTKKAEAGDVYGTLISEDFALGELDTQVWYNRNKFAGLSFESDGNPQLVVKNGQGGIDGSGINGKIPVSATNKISFTIGIKELNFGARAHSTGSGWFGIAYNLKSSDYKTDNAYRAGQGDCAGDGIYFTYNHIEDYHGLVFATLGAGGKFVDGENNPIEQKGEFAFYPVEGLINDISSPAITETTITVEIDKTGKLVCKKGDDILFQSAPDSAMNVFRSGTYYGLTVHRSSATIENAVIDEFTVKCDDSVLNAFDAAHKNSWDFYKQQETPEAYFSPKYDMRVGKDAANKTFSETSPLFLSKEIFLNEDEESFAEFSAKIKTVNIPSGAAIGFLTGSKNYTKDKVGTKNTTFVYVNETDGEFYLGLKTYDAEGTKADLIRAPEDGIKITADSDGYAEMYVKIDADGIITVKINGTERYTSNSDVAQCYGSGYCGIAAEGDASALNVVFSNITVKNRYYSRPTNINVTENFDNGGYNPNEFYFRQEPYMSTFTNTGGYVKDGKLWFDNLAYNTAFTTVYQYSDFEIQFDIDDIRREPVGTGNSKSYPISSFVGVFWGVPDASTRFGDGVSTTYPLIYIATEVDEETWDRRIDDGKPCPTRIFAMGNGLNASLALPEKYDFWDTKNEGKILQFKVSVTGNVVDVYVRYTTDEAGVWCNEDANGNPLTFVMKQAVVGNVAITTMGNNYYVYPHSVGSSCGHFSVDNLMITNKDVGGKTTQAAAGTTYRELPADYQYVKPDNDADYAPQADGGGCGSSVSGKSFAGIVAIALVAAAITVIIRRKSRD